MERRETVRALFGAEPKESKDLYNKWKKGGYQGTNGCGSLRHRIFVGGPETSRNRATEIGSRDEMGISEATQEKIISTATLRN